MPLFLVLQGLKSGSMLYGSDYVTVFYYNRGWIGKELLSGRLPLWDPGTMCGFPLLAALQSAVFYPPTWLTVLLPPAEFWAVTVWGHLAWAGLFAMAWLGQGLRLGRIPALAGSLIVMLSAPLVLRVYAGHINHICAFAWIPAVLWRQERYLADPTPKRGALLGLAIAMLALTGSPQHLFMAGLAAAARFGSGILERRDASWTSHGTMALKMSGWAALGLLLCAPQVLPSLELTGQTQRGSLRDYDFATSYSFPPENLLTFFVPTLMGDAVESPYWGRWFLWEAHGYVGVATIGLVIMGLRGRSTPHRLLWILLGTIGLLLALGRHSPIFWIFHHSFPGASFFRGPGRYLVLFVLGVAPLASGGVAELRLLAPTGRSNRHITMAAAVLAALCFILTVGYLVLNRENQGRWAHLDRVRLSIQKSKETNPSLQELPVDSPRFHQDARRVVNRGMIFSILWSGLSASLLLLAARGHLGAIPASLILTVLAALDLVSFGYRYFRAHPKESMEWPASLAEWIRNRPGFPFRLGTLGMGNIQDCGRCQLAGLQHVGGYEPLLLQRYADMVNSFSGAPLENVVVCCLPAGPHPLLRLMGMRFMILPAGRALPKEWGIAGWIGNRPVVETPNEMPRAFLATQAVFEPDRDRRLRRLSDPHLDLNQVVILEENPQDVLPPETAPSKSSVSLAKTEPGAYEIHVESQGGGYLVLTEAWYPGWEVQVDGVAGRILRANHLFQAVRLEAGTHRVVFRYRSRTLIPGFILAGLAVATAALSWHLGSRGRPFPKPANS